MGHACCSGESAFDKNNFDTRSMVSGSSKPIEPQSVNGSLVLLNSAQNDVVSDGTYTSVVQGVKLSGNHEGSLEDTDSDFDYLKEVLFKNGEKSRGTASLKRHKFQGKKGGTQVNKVTNSQVTSSEDPELAQFDMASLKLESQQSLASSDLDIQGNLMQPLELQIMAPIPEQTDEEMR